MKGKKTILGGSQAQVQCPNTCILMLDSLLFLQTISRLNQVCAFLYNSICKSATYLIILLTNIAQQLRRRMCPYAIQFLAHCWFSMNVNIRYLKQSDFYSKEKNFNKSQPFSLLVNIQTPLLKNCYRREFTALNVLCEERVHTLKCWIVYPAQSYADSVEEPISTQLINAY